VAVEIGFTQYGDGPIRVLVLHDWFCDHSSWEGALPYLTPGRFTYAFADLRGYGASRGIEGDCTLDEAAGDAIALADRLGWTRFSLIGHSMSGLVVQRVAQLVTDRIERIVAITPVAPAGMGLDAATKDVFRSLALAGDEERYAGLTSMWGTRLSDTWIRYKLRRWRETADPTALAKYVDLWGAADISEGARGIATPMLIGRGAGCSAVSSGGVRSLNAAFLPQRALDFARRVGSLPDAGTAAAAGNRDRAFPRGVTSTSVWRARRGRRFAD